jgi:hypothetical protein
MSCISQCGICEAVLGMNVVTVWLGFPVYIEVDPGSNLIL